MTGAGSQPGTIEKDLRDLRRGVAINYIGYLLKMIDPVLLILVVRAYGKEAFGLFMVAQAALFFVSRFCAIGLDKTLLWWVPQQQPHLARRGIRSVVLATGILSTALGIGAALLSEPLLALFGSDPGAAPCLRVMSLGLLPLVWSEVLVHAVMGRRSMKARLVVKEIVFPVTLLAGALLLYLLGTGAIGLAVAFLAANVASAIVALAMYGREFAGAGRPSGEGLLVPGAMMRYTVPMWLAEMANTLLLRLDIYVVAACTDLSTVGIYGVVVHFGNAIRTIRRSFDPIVTAITAEIGASHDAGRLRAGYSYATFLVTATQLPVFVFLMAFARWLMPLYGEGFEAGSTAVVILCGFWVLTGAASLAGLVVAAYGRSLLSLINTLLTIGVQAAALVVLVPRWGLEGASLAVGVAYVVQSAAQLVQMRVITRGWHTDASVLVPIVLGAVALAPLGAVILVPAWAGSLGARIAGFAAFALVYGGVMAHLWRSKRLPGQATGSVSPRP